MNKNMLCALVVVLVSLFAFSALCAESPESKTFFTKVNIWYERPIKILSTNYHRGAILPVGSKVMIISLGDGKIRFNEEKTQTLFTIYHVPKYTNVSIRALFDRYFSETDPMAKDGPFHKFTKMEQENIKKGTIAVGMSKDAVLMAYGYPPTHRTPSIKSDSWGYWLDRKSINLDFRDGKISNIRN